MIYIAHRGNLNGPNKDENKPEYIKKSISLGFDCEIDIRYINNILYLGHDTPDYKIDLQFLSKPRIVEIQRKPHKIDLKTLFRF